MLKETETEEIIGFFTTFLSMELFKLGGGLWAGLRQLTANQMTPKKYFNIPRVMLPKPSLCDETVGSRSVCRG